jgi:hypothetical protein
VIGMPTIEDELRRVMETRSAAPPLAADLSRRIRRAVTRRRRARGLLVAAAALIAVVGAAGSVMATSRPVDQVAPAASVPTAARTASPSWVDGVLPVSPPWLSDRGYRLAVVRSITYPAQSTVELTYTPTSWNFLLGVGCLGSGTVSITVYWSGHLGTRGVRCSPLVVDITPGGTAEKMQQSWQAEGVQLGRPVTLTAHLGTWPTSGPVAPEAVPGTAEAVLGVYLPALGT